MEKPTSTTTHQNIGGVIKLPPGYRFHPTDEELVLQYLTRKVLSCPLPASIIPEIDLGKHNPWDLPGGCEHERYFFAHKEAKYPNGNRSNRATGCGYWKATGKDRAVVATKYNKVVGMKKTLVFYQGKAPNGSRTDWIMHEYRLAAVFPQSKSNNSSGATIQRGDWVICRIFMKKRANKMDVESEGRREIGFIDFMGEQRNEHNRRHSSPSDSDSSCVTGTKEEASNEHETTS